MGPPPPPKRSPPRPECKTDREFRISSDDEALDESRVEALVSDAVTVEDHDIVGVQIEVRASRGKREKYQDAESHGHAQSFYSHQNVCSLLLQDLQDVPSRKNINPRITRD
jgi:hypothetical protein